MGFFNHDDSNEEQAYQQVNERDGSVCTSFLYCWHRLPSYRPFNHHPHQPLTYLTLSSPPPLFADAVYTTSTAHELVGGAAAFLAMRAYEKQQEKEGKPQR
jgi:hypothetical protein